MFAPIFFLRQNTNIVLYVSRKVAREIIWVGHPWLSTLYNDILEVCQVVFEHVKPIFRLTRISRVLYLQCEGLARSGIVLYTVLLVNVYLYVET